jgi:hypothetical protein
MKSKGRKFKTAEATANSSAAQMVLEDSEGILLDCISQDPRRVAVVLPSFESRMPSSSPDASSVHPGHQSAGDFLLPVRMQAWICH